MPSPTERKVDSPVQEELVPLTTEVLKSVRDRIDAEAKIQKRPSRSNMAMFILTQWAEANTKGD
jgi:hypothetical protein